MNQPVGGWQPPADGQAFGQPAQAPMQAQYAPQPGPPGPPGPPGYPQPGVAMQPGPPMQPGMPMPGQQMPPGTGMQAPATVNPFAGMTSGDQSGSARHPFLSGEKEGDSYNGSYRLKVVGLKFLETRAHKMFYIIEAEIQESNQPDRPPGMVCSVFIDLGNRDTGPKHLAGFLASVFGYDPLQLPKDSPVAPWADPSGQAPSWESVAQASIDPSQPLVGRELGCTVVQIKTGQGKPWSLHTWSPIGNFVIPPSVPPLLFPNPVKGGAPAGVAPPPGWGPPPAGAPQVMAGPPPASAIPAQAGYPPQPGYPLQPGYPPQAPPMPPQAAPPAQYPPQAAPVGPPAQYAPQAAPPAQYPPQAAPAGPPAPHTPAGSWGGTPTQ